MILHLLNLDGYNIIIINSSIDINNHKQPPHITLVQIFTASTVVVLCSK